MKAFFLFSGNRSYNYRMMRIQEIGNHPEKAEIEKRLRAIEFSKLYGINAALDAFQVSRSTLFSWKKKLRKHGGMVNALAPGSRAPYGSSSRKKNDPAGKGKPDSRNRVLPTREREPLTGFFLISSC